MKLLLALAPAVASATTLAPSTTSSVPLCVSSPNSFGCTPTGYCVGAAQGAALDDQTCIDIGETSPCFSWGLSFVTDCQGMELNACTWLGDGYCDDATYYPTDFNCVQHDFDGGDCDLIIDCDGNEVLANLLQNGECNSGTVTQVNFDCLEYNYDGGDCAPRNCDGSCIDEYPTTDGTCQEEFNCKKFEYSFDECAPKNICPDDWYETGRENYRCSENTGGNRFSSTVMLPFDACECYDFCQTKAEENGFVLSAFDQYSDKCRCWEGDCTDTSLIECKADGINATSFTGTDGRCPSGVFFPHLPVAEDCHPEGFEQDVTKYQGYFWENYYNDGYCDNAEYGRNILREHDWGDMPIGDYATCDTFGNDGEDCLAATCDEIFEATEFAVLDTPNLVCDGHDDEIVKETEWTTACDCYEFCHDALDAVDPAVPVDSVMYQRNANGQCQCLSHCDSQSDCGLESGCQIFYADVITDCCGDDWTLGKVVTELDETTLGDFYTHRVNSQQESMQRNKVISFDTLETISTRGEYCVPEFMCAEYAFSFGEVDSNDDIVSSPCFKCLVQSQDQLEEFSIVDTRCDMSSNDGIRFLQLTDFYATGSGRTPLDLVDYCTCEIACRLAKFEFYATGTCAAVSGMAGYNDWLNDDSTAFAVDSYKGDCRCWDYCTADTVWTCTVGQNDRCNEPVAVLLWTDPGSPIVLPAVRPNGGIN